jgi:hypothetical protein
MDPADGDFLALVCNGPQVFALVRTRDRTQPPRVPDEAEFAGQAALRVRTAEMRPFACLQTLHSLSHPYYQEHQWQEALATCEAGMRVSSKGRQGAGVFTPSSTEKGAWRRGVTP